MKGRNGSTSFLPLNKKDGWINDELQKRYLTEDQTNYIYDKIESGDEITVRKIRQESQNYRTYLHKNLRGKDLYEKALVRDINTSDKNKSQMEQWSILSDNIVYVRSVGYDVMSTVDIKMVDYCDHRKIYKKMGKGEG